RACQEKEFDHIFHLKNHPERFGRCINRITSKDLEDYFIFSVVRNPWDRMVSVSSYFDLDFKAYIKEIDRYWEDQNIKIHSLPITTYTHNNGTPFVEFICRFESLQPDMNLVFDQIGIDRRDLPLVNQSKHKHYAYYYTDFEREKVDHIYREDIKFYGYSFHSDHPPNQPRTSLPAADLFSKVKRKLFQNS
ncbi:MAG: sulfotransferase family 2 domain-containing protein, partial [Chloroflexota bacterium]